MEKAIFDPLIPYVGAIHEGRFTPGKKVRIEGIASGSADRFNIYLQCGPETIRRDDVVMMISVRFTDGYISLNSLQNGNWGEEQRGAALPIKRAKKFEIILKCDLNRYRVLVNGDRYCTFPQRIRYDRISHLAIDGDVSILQISYESTVGGEVRTTSGNGLVLGKALTATPASMPVTQLEINATVITPLQPESGIGCSPPPSYKEAMKNQQKGSKSRLLKAHSADAHTGGAPYPTVDCVLPVGPPGAPQNTAPNSTGTPRYIFVNVPIHRGSRNVAPVQPSTSSKVAKGICGVFLGLVIAIGVVFLKFIVRYRSY